MINLSYNGIKNTLASFNMLNISFNGFDSKKKTELTSENIQPEKEKKIIFKDYKTTLGGSKISLIEKMKEDLLVYLFIQKDKDHSAWNLVAPTILEKSIEKIHQYGLGYFALEGSGGGLGNTDSLMFYLKKHKAKGYKVSMLPKIVENKLLDDYEYADSGIKLSDLLENSIELTSYRKDSFKWIYKQYNELLEKYELE